jgi:AcrR family transcriptional regulator
MATAIAIRDSERLQRRERRRRELLDAADRVIHRSGAGFSMDEIASEAGITKPVVYRHFGDKDGLHEALTERYIDELKQALRPATQADDPRSRLAATIDAYLSYVEQEPDRYRFLLAAAEQPKTATLVEHFRREHIGECAFTSAAKLERAGLDPRFAEPWAHCVSGMIRAAGGSWLENRSLPRRRLVDYLTAVLWDGFAALRAQAAKLPSDPA